MRTALTLLILGCATAPAEPLRTETPIAVAPAEPAPPDVEPVTRITAALDGATIHVTLEMPAAWIPRLPEAVDLLLHDQTPFEDEPRGFAGFVTTPSDADAEPWSGRFLIRDGALVARYDVRLEHHLRRPVRGLDDVPHPTRGGWFLAGRAFVPRAMRLSDGRAIETPVELRFETALPVIGSAPQRDGVFTGETLREIADAFFVAGAFHTRDLERGAVRVRLVSSDFGEPALETMAAFVDRALSLGERELGPLPGGELFIVHDREPSGIAGSVQGRAISILSPDGPSGRARADDGVVLIHELGHLWNRSDTWWINEGFARWWETRLGLVLDGAGDDEAVRALDEIWQRYLSEASGRTIEASEGAWGYAAGALAAFCMEGRLREVGSTLGEVHRAAREGSPQSASSTIDRQVLLDRYGERTAEGRAELEALLAAPGPIAIGPCLERAGLRLARGHVTRRRPGSAIFASP